MGEFTVTEPGIYQDIPEDVYHADCVPGGSLSVSGAKKLLPPYCPAIYDHERRNGSKRTKAMDKGTRAHALILGKDREHLEMLDFENYRTKKAQDARDAAIAAGKIPTLPHELAEAAAIEAAVRDDDTAGALFDKGTAEQSLFWRDAEYGIWKRARPDWATLHGELVDLKTCESAEPGAIRNAIARYGYYMQDPWYREGWQQLTGEYRDFLFVFVQTTAPYLVTVARLEPDAIAVGEARGRRACEIYRDCTEAGQWPGYAREIVPVALPRWQERLIESETENDWH